MKRILLLALLLVACGHNVTPIESTVRDLPEGATFISYNGHSNRVWKDAQGCIVNDRYAMSEGGWGPFWYVDSIECPQ